MRGSLAAYIGGNKELFGSGKNKDVFSPPAAPVPLLCGTFNNRMICNDSGSVCMSDIVYALEFVGVRTVLICDIGIMPSNADELEYFRQTRSQVRAVICLGEGHRSFLHGFDMSIAYPRLDQCMDAALRLAAPKEAVVFSPGIKPHGDFESVEKRVLWFDRYLRYR